MQAVYKEAGHKVKCISLLKYIPDVQECDARGDAMKFICRANKNNY